MVEGGLEGNIQLALPPPQRESGQAKPMQAGRQDRYSSKLKHGIQTVNCTDFSAMCSDILGLLIRITLGVHFSDNPTPGPVIQTFLRLVFRQSYSWASYTDVPEIGIQTVLLLDQLYRHS
jgi:hypothetical protein